MTMKTESIPVIAVFKNGIVNVNKAVAVIPSVVRGVATKKGLFNA